VGHIPDCCTHVCPPRERRVAGARGAACARRALPSDRRNREQGFWPSAHPHSRRHPSSRGVLPLPRRARCCRAGAPAAGPRLKLNPWIAAARGPPHPPLSDATRHRQPRARHHTRHTHHAIGCSARKLCPRLPSAHCILHSPHLALAQEMGKSVHVSNTP
jgi:hypothetical protein